MILKKPVKKLKTYLLLGALGLGMYSCAKHNRTDPTINNIITKPADTYFDISFNTNEDSKCIVMYSLGNKNYDLTKIVDTGFQNTHSSTIDNLLENSMYNFIISCTDEVNRTTLSENNEIKTTQKEYKVIISYSYTDENGQRWTEKDLEITDKMSRELLDKVVIYGKMTREFNSTATPTELDKIVGNYNNLTAEEKKTIDWPGYILDDSNGDGSKVDANEIGKLDKLTFNIN